jgi:hypothetical protein
MKYKVGDEVFAKGVIVSDGDSNHAVGTFYHVKFNWATWVCSDMLYPPPVWRDGAVESWNPQTDSDRKKGYYWRYKGADTPVEIHLSALSHIGESHHNTYWIPADEFPMPAMPEPVPVPVIEPCPFCNGECEVLEPEPFMDEHWVECTNRRCRYAGATSETPAEAIAAHNELARKVRA